MYLVGRQCLKQIDGFLEEIDDFLSGFVVVVALGLQGTIKHATVSKTSFTPPVLTSQLHILRISCSRT